MTTEIWAAGSSVAAMITAIIMLVQTIYQRKQDNASDIRRIDIEEKILAQKRIDNRIMVNRNWTELNTLIISSPEHIRSIVSDRYYKDVGADIFYRMQLCFLLLNNIEITWLLKKNDLLDQTTLNNIDDMVSILHNDTDALKLVLNKRGFSPDFTAFIWHRIFPDQPMPG